MKPTRQQITNYAPYAGLLVAALILLYPVIDHHASFCILPDNVQQAYPWMNKLASSLHKGYLPLWDANAFGGRSFAGETQTGIFYPPNILWCLLFGSANGIDVYYLDLLVALHYFIALIGMYRVARILNLSVAGSMSAAAIYTFTGALAGRAGGETCIFFGLALIPWVVFSVAAYYRYNKRIYIIIAGLIAGLQILAGHLQPFFHTLILLLAVAWEAYKKRETLTSLLIRASILLSIITIIAAIIALPQLYYSHEYFATCYRHVNGGAIITPGEKVPLFIYSHLFVLTLADLPNLFHQEYNWDKDSNTIYMGILPLALIVGYLLLYIYKKTAPEYRSLTRGLLILCTIGILGAIGYQTFFNLFLYEIPMVSVLCRQPARYIILISFSASLLAGLGLQHLKEIKESLIAPHRNMLFYGAVLLAANQLYLCIFQSEFIPLSMSVPLLLLFVFLIVMAEHSFTQYLPAIAIGVIFADLWLNPVSYRSTRNELYPPIFYQRDKVIDFLQTNYGRYRVKTSFMGNGALPRFNLGDVYSIQTDLGYGATENMAYMNFYRSSKLSQSDIDDFLNIRYILTNVQLDSSYRFVDSTTNWKLYERKNYYPRMYWKKQLGKPGKTIEVENKDKINLLAYSDLSQRYNVNCISSDTLIFSENTYPGWNCYDNGRPIPITAATISDYPRIFRSIALDPGQHVIEFRYRRVFHWF